MGVSSGHWLSHRRDIMGGHSYHIRHAWLGVYIAPAWLVVTQARHIGKGPIPATARAPGRGRWPRGEHATPAFLSAVPAQHHCDELPTQRGASAPLPPPPCLNLCRTCLCQAFLRTHDDHRHHLCLFTPQFLGDISSSAPSPLHDAHLITSSS